LLPLSQKLDTASYVAPQGVLGFSHQRVQRGRIGLGLLHPTNLHRDGRRRGVIGRPESSLTYMALTARAADTTVGMLKEGAV
jgi:hypothetical protein